MFFSTILNNNFYFLSLFCDNESGYIQSNIIPKFASVINGVNWFKSMDQFKDKNYIPKESDIVFFDWEADGKPNHVEIVKEVIDNKVYVIEEISYDVCRENTYDIGSKYFYGFGVPNY